MSAPQVMQVISGRVARAQRRGYVVSGWNILDYIRNAVDKHGWEVIIIHGVKGCLPKEQLILTDEGVMSANEFEKKEKTWLVSYDNDEIKYNLAFPVLVGKKTFWDVKTDRGRFVVSTEQPFLTPFGWKELSELKIGDKVLYVQEPLSKVGSQNEELRALRERIRAEIRLPKVLFHPLSKYIHKQNEDDFLELRKEEGVLGNTKRVLSQACEGRNFGFFKEANILSIERICEDNAIDIHVLNAHNFFLDNGFLTHNTLKSNLLMQFLYHYYQDWDTVLTHVMMQPIDYVNCWGEGELGRVPIIGHDDVSAHFPSHLYHINRELYHTFSKDWALIRPHLNVFACTAPHKHRIVPIISEEITSEIVTNINNTYDHQRWAWDIDLKDYRKEIARPIMAETEMPIRMNDVPFIVFKKYWARRLELSRQAHKDFLGIMKELQESLQTVSTKFVEGELPKELKDFTGREMRHFGGALMRRVGKNMNEVEVHNTVMGILKEMRKIPIDGPNTSIA